MSAQWEVGQILKQARTMNGLSQRAAATQAGISPTRWRQIEDGFETIRGTRVPVRVPRDTLLAVAAAVGAVRGDVLLAALRSNQVAARKSTAGAVLDVSGLSPSQIEQVNDYVAILRWRRRLAEATQSGKPEPGKGGRPRMLSPAQVLEVRARWAEGESDGKLADAFGVSRMTINSYRRGIRIDR